LIAVSDLLVGATSALWLGILTSISPCPLATNIAAISFVGRRVDSPRHVLAGGLLYSVGRTAAYVALGAIFVLGLLSVPGVSWFLQRYMNRILGPVLVVTGILLLELVPLRLPAGGRMAERLRNRFQGGGIWGAAPLGALFALSFCPISAALFFGSLVPLALRSDSPVLYPSLYGVGTALPVVAFSFLIAFGARFVGRAFDRLAAVERWARRLTGVVFIVVGVYMTLAFTFEINLW
jgi:cytochrome c-type biogenesis protein